MTRSFFVVIARLITRFGLAWARNVFSVMHAGAALSIIGLFVLAGCGGGDSITGTADDTSPPIRITRTLMDTMPQTDTVYVGWYLTYTFSPETNKLWRDDNNHLLYSVDDPAIASVNLRFVDPVELFSQDGRTTIGWQYNQPVSMFMMKSGKFTLTVWPWSDTRLKKRITFVVLPVGKG